MERPSSTSFLVPVLIRAISGRAGTTLLMELLGTCPRIAFERVHPYEQRYFCYLLERVTSMHPAGGPTRRRAIRMVASKASPLSRKVAPPQWSDRGWDEPMPFRLDIVDPQEFVRLSLRHQWEAFSEAVVSHAEGPTPLYYAEKARPFDQSVVDFPFRVIYLVRDPRDVWASINAFDAKRGFYGFGRRPWQPRRSYLRQYIRRIEGYAREEQAGAPEAILVRYEDLVGNLEAESERLTSWLRVDLAPSKLAGPRSALEAHKTSESPKDSIGRWRSDVPAQERRILTGNLADVLRRYGYRL